MSTDAAKVRMLQANLEHMVGQLEAANKETAAAVADASKQRELVGQITKKLDSVSKKNKALEKDAQRILSSREHMVSTEVQSEPDAVLLAAHAEVATLTEAVAKAREDATVAESAREQASAAAARPTRIGSAPSR